MNFFENEFWNHIILLEMKLIKRLPIAITTIHFKWFGYYWYKHMWMGLLKRQEKMNSHGPILLLLNL